ncbi:unnamed protein product [Prorocentrum cordatum]|uniref:Uncharacterized protein n=1 Tax=Prorocentrum cordatum TaxID=2364126 RepID=A0ABN9PR27_9DINO|nr:unnamed protein product [Polarella glacialis]
MLVIMPRSISIGQDGDAARRRQRSEEAVVERLSPAEVVEDWHGSGGCAELKTFPPEDPAQRPPQEARSHPKLSVGRERVDFWWSVCQNAAASEIVVNLALPWFLCDVQGMAISTAAGSWPGISRSGGHGSLRARVGGQACLFAAPRDPRARARGSGCERILAAHRRGSSSRQRCGG